MKEAKPIELDGRTGEGGGQLVRIAVALASVATQPIRIMHVRGNREGARGGGLKAQHVASIDWLVRATAAEVTGLAVGSQTLEFRPRLRPSQLADRKIEIVAATPAASALLILQAILPFLLFAGGSEPIELRLCGGTNVAWSLSYEYLDQVLLPTLHEHFGVAIERRLEKRGWSVGPQQDRGIIWLRVHPLPLGQTLRRTEAGRRKVQPEDFKLKAIDVSLLAPASMHEELQNALVKDLETLIPDLEVNFKLVEDTGWEARIYVLLVARSETLRWGRDILTSAPRKGKGKGKGRGKGSRSETFLEGVSRKVCKDLYEEVILQGTVDEFLQDQLVVFQALAEGESSFTRDEMGRGLNDLREETLEEGMEGLKLEKRRRKDKMHEPFGQGSTHTTTARWVTGEVIPKVVWCNKGTVCEGVGMKMY